MATLEQLVANVVKIRGFIAVYLDLPALNAKQAEALRIDLNQLDKNLAALAAYQPPVKAVAATPEVVTYTAAEVWAKFLDAQDVVLIAAGKPAGRDGAERGSVTRDEALAIVAGLGIPDALMILASAGYGFGPEPGKDVLA